MHRALFALTFIFAIGICALPASAATDSPLVEEKEGLEDLKRLPAPGIDLEALPPANNENAVTPKAVFRRGCIPFPGARRFVTFTIPPRRTTFLAVTPDRFFDVTMRVRGRGLNRFVDRFFEGRTETFRVFNRSFFRERVTVTIGGFLGSTGCFFFSARP